MLGAPVGAIQELAGHADLSTTMRYMHLSPASLNQAIRLARAAAAAAGRERGERYPSAGNHG
jgi:site-specific recombinase XerD